MSIARTGQTAVFLSGLMLMTAVNAVAVPGLWGQVLILAPAVALLGLPHGALDLPMAKALWPLDTTADRAGFFAAYLALAAGVAALWMLAPGFALAAFLACSALHFSGDWAADGWLMRAAGGLSAIGAPVLFHTAEAAAIFSLLGPEASALPVARFTAAAGLCGAVLVLVTLLRRAPPNRRALLELVGIWIGAALLPPLLYFVVYFCLLHSLRHLVETLAQLPDRRGAWRSAGAIMAISLVGSGLALAALTQGGGMTAEASVLRVVFIGLAALTVPHMLLVERFERRRSTRHDSTT